MEYRDLYDKNRNLTGKTIAKDEKTPEGYYILIVVCFMENTEGKFLMQKDPYKKMDYGEQQVATQKLVKTH